MSVDATRVLQTVSTACAILFLCVVLSRLWQLRRYGNVRPTNWREFVKAVSNSLLSVKIVAIPDLITTTRC